MSSCQRRSAGPAPDHQPLVFLGGTFDPVVYLVSGFRWSFFGTADVDIGISIAAIAAFTLACLAVVAWIFRTGYKVRA